MKMIFLSQTRWTASIAATAAVALTACGGGGGGSSTSAPVTPDTTAPTLAATPAVLPANGTSGIAYATTVEFTASEPLSAAGIKLSCSGADVPGSTTISGSRVVFKPAAPGLAADAQCTATVAASATKDLAGNMFTGSTTLTSFTVKPLACSGSSTNSPPMYAGTALLAACGNVFVDPSVAKNQWPVIVDSISAATASDKQLYGTLAATQPDVVVCNLGACADYFAGTSRRNTTLLPNTYAGQYVAPRLTVVLTSATWDRNPYVLAHEFSHAEVATRTGGQHVPAWFDEGLATYVGGEPVCTNVTAKGIADLRQLDIESDWVAYTAPDDVFTKTYCQARAEVAAWITKRGNAAVVQLLDSVRLGQPFWNSYGAMQTQ